MLSLQRRFVIFCTLCYFFIVSQAQDSPTNQAYLFAADAESLLYSNLVASFSCQGRDYGYYADVPNNCQVRNNIRGLSSTFLENIVQFFSEFYFKKKILEFYFEIIILL